MNKWLLALTASTLIYGWLPAMETSLLPPQEQEKKLIIHNRILAKVHDKTISVLDVVKKMDVFLNRYYPDLANSPGARYQYFSSQWKETLSQMIDNELIMADAEKLELKTTDAEVRERVLERFGPNIMTSLDKIGITYEEARKMIHAELVVEKMTWYRIHSKALQNVNPQDIKVAYQKYCEKNPSQEKWDYQVLSIRTKDASIGEQLAQKAYDLLQSTQSGLLSVKEKLQTELTEQSETSVTVSEEFSNTEKTISDAHKEVLSTLQTKAISAPIRQTSRYDNSVVYRIFYLKNHTRTVVPPFSQMSEKIKDELLNQAVTKESQTYIAKLRSKFGYDTKSIQDTIPNDFQPFSLQ